jgi:hypothetical protein
MIVRVIVDCNTNKEYIKYIKSKPCSVCGSLEVDAHHMDFIGMGGNRKKPSLKDFSCVSLCRIHHTEYHSLGHKKFTDKYNRDLWKEVYYNLRGFYCE